MSSLWRALCACVFMCSCTKQRLVDAQFGICFIDAEDYQVGCAKKPCSAYTRIHGIVCCIVLSSISSLWRALYGCVSMCSCARRRLVNAQFGICFTATEGYEVRSRKRLRNHVLYLLGYPQQCVLCCDVFGSVRVPVGVHCVLMRSCVNARDED